MTNKKKQTGGNSGMMVYAILLIFGSLAAFILYTGRPFLAYFVAVFGLGMAGTIAENDQNERKNAPRQ